MQRTDVQSDKNQKDDQPVYQLQEMLEDIIIKYMSCALKFDKTNDNLEPVREVLTKLKSAIHTASPLIEAHNQRVPPRIPDLLNQRHQTALARFKMADSKLNELRSVYKSQLTELQHAESLLLNQIQQVENTPGEIARRSNKAKLQQLMSEKNRLEKDSEPPKESTNILKRLFTSTSQHPDHHVYAFAQLKTILKQIDTLESKMQETGDNTCETLNTDLAEIKHDLATLSEQYGKKIHTAEVEYGHSEAKLFATQLEVTKIQLQFNSNLSVELMYACLRIYICIIELHKVTHQCQEQISSQNKTNRYNPEEEFKNPYARAQALMNLTTHHQKKFEKFLGILHCENSGDRNGLEIYEVFKSDTLLLQKIMNMPMSPDLLNHVVPSMNVKTQDRARVTSTAFFTDPKRNSRDAGSIATSAHSTPANLEL